MGEDLDKDFKRLLEDAKTDPNIIGFFLGGSRGKGFQTKYSDYDVRMIVKEKVVKKYRRKYGRMKLKNIDLAISSLSEFKKYAKWGSSYQWDRYDFTHVKVIIDKTKNKQIQKIVDEKGRIPEKVRRKFVAGSLDAYINGVYRSLKSFKKGHMFGFRLEAVQAIPYFLDVIFGLEGRPRPFYSYLERELKYYPLKKFPWSRKKLLNSLLKIMNTGDIKTQLEMLREIGKIARREGYEKIIKSWEVDHPNLFNLTLNDFMRMKKI